MNLQLNFSLPEEEKEAELAIYSKELFNTLLDYNNWLRSMSKSGEDVDVDNAKEQFWKIVEDNNILHLFNI